jgi:hypothetical protein
MRQGRIENHLGERKVRQKYSQIQARLKLASLKWESRAQVGSLVVTRNRTLRARQQRKTPP